MRTGQIRVNEFGFKVQIHNKVHILTELLVCVAKFIHLYYFPPPPSLGLSVIYDFLLEVSTSLRK